MAQSGPGKVLRDLFRLDELHSRCIPTVLPLSGGYSRESYRLAARTVERVVKDVAVD
jgi:hypothetical protein